MTPEEFKINDIRIGDRVVIKPAPLVEYKSLNAALDGTDRVMTVEKLGKEYVYAKRGAIGFWIRIKYILGHALECWQDIEFSNDGNTWSGGIFSFYEIPHLFTFVSTFGVPFKYARPIRPEPEPKPEPPNFRAVNTCIECEHERSITHYAVRCVKYNAIFDSGYICDDFEPKRKAGE